MKAPSEDKWMNGLDALYDILETEKKLNVKLRYLHRQASKHDDPHVRIFMISLLTIRIF